MREWAQKCKLRRLFNIATLCVSSRADTLACVKAIRMRSSGRTRCGCAEECSMRGPCKHSCAQQRLMASALGQRCRATCTSGWTATRCACQLRRVRAAPRESGRQGTQAAMTPEARLSVDYGACVRPLTWTARRCVADSMNAGGRAWSGSHARSLRGTTLLPGTCLLQPC